MMVVSTMITYPQHPLDGFILGLATFIFIWKTGLIDVIGAWWPPVS